MFDGIERDWIDVFENAYLPISFNSLLIGISNFVKRSQKVNERLPIFLRLGGIEILTILDS